MTPPMIYVLYYCQIGFKIFKMEIQPAKIGLFNPIIMTKSKGIWGLAENDLENAWNMLELWSLSTTNIQQPRVNRMDSQKLSDWLQRTENHRWIL